MVGWAWDVLGWPWKEVGWAWDVLGWVWDGRIIAGDTLAGPDLYTTPRQPPHFRRNMKTEHHQPVLCLRRPNQPPRASTRHAGDRAGPQA